MRIDVRNFVDLDKIGVGRYDVYAKRKKVGTIYRVRGRWKCELKDKLVYFKSRRDMIRAVGILFGAKRTDPKCLVCGKNSSDEYLVHDSLWAKAGFEKGYCHIECLERRLGRRLALKDFPRHILNNEIRWAMSR